MSEPSEPLDGSPGSAPSPSAGEAGEGGAPPERFGPYRVLGLLGSGGMGEVYLAYDDRLGRSVAIKRIRADRQMTSARRERLRREARAVAKLSHPAVVQVYDILEGDDGDAIVMEYVEGHNVARRLGDGELSLPSAVRIGRQVAEGLAAAHERGLIHRDLKAENVLLTAAGDAKVVDFGLVKTVSEDAEETALTDDGAVLGTYRSMSPEQASGEPVDERTDLFSLGVLLYEMLTGTPPVRGRTPAQTLTRLLTEPVEPVARRRPGLPDDLAALVDSLLDREPEHRPSGALAVARALGAVETRLPAARDVAEGEQHGDSFAGEAASSGTAESPRPRRWPWWLGAAAVAALVILWAVARPAWLPRGASRPQPAAASPEPTTAYGHIQTASVELAHFYREGAIDQAIAGYRRALALDPDSAPAYTGLARAYWRKARDDGDGQWLDQALAHATRAVELDEHLTAARVARGLIRAQRREHDAALAELRQVLVLDPANADVHRGLGDVYRAQGRDDEAEAAYEQAIELRPDDWELHSELGALYYRAGRYEEAEAAFARGVDLTPDNFHGYKNLAAAYHGQGRFADAAAELQRSLEIRPDPQVYSNLGTLYFFQGLYEQSASAFERALELGANGYLYWANLGDAYRFLPDKGEEARTAFRRAAQLLRERQRDAPDDVTLSSRLALFLAKAGDAEGARAELAALERLGADTPAVLYRTATAHEVLGDRAAALAALGAALAAGASPSQVASDPELAELRADLRYHRLLLEIQSGAEEAAG